MRSGLQFESRLSLGLWLGHWHLSPLSPQNDAWNQVASFYITLLRFLVQAYKEKKIVSAIQLQFGIPGGSQVVDMIALRFETREKKRQQA